MRCPACDERLESQEVEQGCDFYCPHCQSRLLYEISYHYHEHESLVILAPPQRAGLFDPTTIKNK